MTDDDLNAIYAYLRSRRPVRHDVSNTDSPTLCPVCGQQHGLGERNHVVALTPVSVDAATLREYAGEYRFNDGLMLRFAEADGHLRLLFGDGPPVTLIATSQTEFRSEEVPDVIQFVRDKDGRVTHILDNTDEIGERVR